MHKSWLGLSSLVMAGLLTVTSVGTSLTTVYAAETDSESAIVVEDAAEEVTEESVVELLDEDAPVEEGTSEEAPVEVEEPVAEENGLVFFDRWNQSATCSGKLSFSKQYQEFCYDLGTEYNAAAVKGVHIKVSDQGGNVCIKLYDAQMNEKQPNYSNNGSSEYVIVPNYDGTVKYIGVMSMLADEASYPYGITIDEITVDAEEVAPVVNEETLVFEGDSLVFNKAWQSEDEEPIIIKDGKLEFAKEWDQYNLSLGKTIAGEDLKSLKVTLSEANSQSIALKIYGNGEEINANYGKNGSTTYTWAPSSTTDVDAIAIMAMNEQTYPFTVSVEKVEIVVDTTPASERPQAGVEYDIVDLRDPVEALMGEDFIIGTAVSYDEFRDENDLALTTKHFNGVTLGNELKPDAMLKKGAEITQLELNGEMVDFPVLDFATPESRLDYFLDWNEKHPEKKIRIRGHVLVWHSQTPDFFFHEDYDTSKPYVTPEVMNKRLEIYIREVAHHFTAEGSKYAGMFYGWDVVNEAVSDGTGTYRNASENSTWWRVYQSPEFINNAFVYANRYMPSDIALFYNDYNDTTPNKVTGICKLIENVKATPGARIDGMGMQAHYQVAANSPTMEQFKIAARRYAELVDQIQVTELDFKGSTGPTDENLANRYKAVYDTIRRLRAEGINFTGMTIWGVTDKHSWLQTSNSAGGGANGNSKQYPLLFDDYYKAKNAFWVLVNAGELEPEIKNLTLIQNAADDFAAGESYKFGDDETSVSFVPMWKDGEIDVKVTVADATVDATDAFVVYTDDGAELKATEVKRSNAQATDAGYTEVVKISVDAQALSTNKVKFDLVAVNGEKKVAFGDTTFNQEQSSKYFAETVIKPLLSVVKGTVTVDGEGSDAAWAEVKEFPLSINLGADVTANAKVLWDEEKLYVLVDVKDEVLNKDSSDAWQQDSVEFFIDENNAKSSSYQEDDKQYRVNYENTHSFNGTKCLEENIESAAVLTEEGYRIEASFKWTDIQPTAGTKVGFELQINDANASGKRSGTLSWADKTGNGYASPEVFGTILLTEGTPVAPTPETPEVKAELVTKWGVTYLVTEDGEKLTGFQDVDGDTYYFEPKKGAMQKSTWVTVEGKKYYAKKDGVIAKSEVVDKWTSKYIVDEEGVLQTGFFTFEGNDYYANEKGALQKSTWITSGNDKYYAKADYTLAKDETITKWGKKYTFDKDGKLVK